MGKASKSKREEPAVAKPQKGEEGYEFKLPKFDERAFIRREVLTARASFYTIALGFAAGIASVVLYAAGLDWKLGWLPILLSMFIIRPILTALKFPEDVTKWKALIGSFIMLFFTGLAVWIFGVNLVG